MIHPLFQQILGAHGIKQASFDRALPVDDRTDEQIEQDAFERVRAEKYKAHLDELILRTKNRQHLWDVVEARRLAE